MDNRKILPETVWDAFWLHATLKDLTKHYSQEVLEVPHNALNKHRLDAALARRNHRIASQGQDQYGHACFKCMKITTSPDGRLGTLICCSWFLLDLLIYVGIARITAAATDGVTMGHPCCNVRDCQTALSSVRDLFCPDHLEYQYTCGIQGCSFPCDPGWRTCNTEQHRTAEQEAIEAGDAYEKLMWKYKLSTQREDMHGSLEKSTKGPKKLHTTFGRRWTHNEQLMVMCCGTIISRATFFGSEGVTDVKASITVLVCPNNTNPIFEQRFILETFPPHYPGYLPSYLFYDNNCQLLKHLAATTLPQDASLLSIGLPVDVFHAKTKHQVSDTFCQEHCNPALFQELRENGAWVFNSSICEQTNRWFVRFFSICREMTPVHYNFFLDEMIRGRNEWLVEQLQQQGHRPHFIPMEDMLLQI